MSELEAIVDGAELGGIQQVFMAYIVMVYIAMARVDRRHTAGNNNPLYPRDPIGPLTCRPFRLLISRPLTYSLLTYKLPTHGPLTYGPLTYKFVPSLQSSCEYV